MSATIACLVARLWKGPELPAPARPALTIMVAIPSVALLAVLQQPDPSGWLTTTAFGLKHCCLSMHGPAAHFSGKSFVFKSV